MTSDNDLRRAAHINAEKLVTSEARAAMREKIIKLYADKWGVTDAWLADAAIDVALEEAARLVRQKSREIDGDPWNSGYNAALEDADAAIRALKGKRAD